MKKDHAMCDLETLGLTPGCSMLSIGAVYFDQTSGELGDEFYCTILRSSCLEHGLYEDPGTVEYWAKNAAKSEVHASFMKACEDPAVSYTLPDALEQFNEFIRGGQSVKVWGNGADFDNGILRAAYHHAKVKPAGSWHMFNGRCYRTIKQLFPSQKLQARQGTHHNALDDAKSQAVHLIQLAQAGKLVLS